MTLPEFDVAPYRLSGVVIGCLMNHAPALAALGAAAQAAPYKAPPKAPVLYVKPRNSLAVDGAVIEVPTGTAALEIGAALGLVIGRTACRVSLDYALGHVAGGIIVADISVPHASYYRPSVRLKARDGFCPLGPRVAPLRDPDALAVRVYLDDQLVHETDTGGRIRNAASLVSEVSDFMTLNPGDILMLGVSFGAPLVRPGQRAAIEIDGLGRLQMSFVAERVNA